MAHCVKCNYFDHDDIIGDVAARLWILPLYSFIRDGGSDGMFWRSVFMAINYPLTYTLGFLYISYSGSANAQLPGCICPWTFSLNFRLNKFPLDSFFTFPTRIFYREVPGFAIDCPCRVWCSGLTTCSLYVGPLFGNIVQNDSRFVSLT